MDIRIQKSKRSIINAFIELRSHRELNKISVVELCKSAEINKSTFYSYYHDIYDLSDQLENNVVKDIVASINHPENIFDDLEAFTIELFKAYMVKDGLIQILFSGTRSLFLPQKLIRALKELIIQYCPEYQDDTEKNIMFSFKIYGGYYAYIENKKYGAERVIQEIAKLSKN